MKHGAIDNKQKFYFNKNEILSTNYGIYYRSGGGSELAYSGVKLTCGIN